MNQVSRQLVVGQMAITTVQSYLSWIHAHRQQAVIGHIPDIAMVIGLYK